MRILHVCLADPFTHRGGLNQYCRDLLVEQIKQGHEAKVLFPVGVRNNNKVKIKQKQKNKFILINALPVPINKGIDNPNRYMKNVIPDGYRDFLMNYQPDVIHIHSIQGIHKEFFQVAKQMGIKMVFTTHDYYPICFRCVLFDNHNELCSGREPHKCADCNSYAGMNSKIQRVYQSYFYQEYKNNHFFSVIKKMIEKRNSKNKASKNRVPDKAENSSLQIKDFDKLSRYYRDILSYCDCIIANSQIAFDIYKKEFPEKEMKKCIITHANIPSRIADISEKKNNHYNIAYMGGARYDKGYYVLEKALDKLDGKNIINWDAWLYGEKIDISNITQKDRRHYEGYFTEKDEKNIWRNIDILVVPSQWPETFGFIVIEALSRNIPVICSDLVGSKELIEQVDKQLVFKHADFNDLANKIIDVCNVARYNNIRKKISLLNFDFDIKTHTTKIMEIYNK